MIKQAIITSVLLFLCFELNSQHLIGLKRDEVLNTMQKTSFVVDKSSRNTTFNYIKYIDKVEEKTLLVFFSEDNICNATKLMCEYSSLKSKLAEFNKNYKAVSKNEWQYTRDGKTFKVVLKKEEWFYSIIITPKN